MSISKHGGSTDMYTKDTYTTLQTGSPTIKGVNGEQAMKEGTLMY